MVKESPSRHSEIEKWMCVCGILGSEKASKGLLALNWTNILSFLVMMPTMSSDLSFFFGPMTFGDLLSFQTLSNNTDQVIAGSRTASSVNDTDSRPFQVSSERLSIRMNTLLFFDQIGHFTEPNCTFTV
jgi:hypothetical protein